MRRQYHQKQTVPVKLLNLKPYLPRPILAVLAVLGVLFAIDLFALGAYRQLEHAVDDLRARSEMLDALRPLPVILLQMQSGMRGYLLTGEEIFLRRYRAASESFPAAIAHAQALVGDDPAQRARLEETARLTEAWLATYLSPLVVKRSASEGARSTMAAVLNTVREGKGEALGNRIAEKVEEIQHAEAARVAGAAGRIQAELGSVAQWMLARGAALLVGLAALALLLGRTIERLGGQIRGREVAERAARQSEAARRAMDDASPLGMFVANVAGSCTHANAAFARISGLAQTALLEQGWQTALHPDDRDRVLPAWNQAIAGQQGFASEHRFLHRSGHVVWVTMKAATMNDGDQLIGFVCTVEDVTERREAEEALRKSEERLHLALESSGLALFDWHVPSGEMFLSRQWGVIAGDRQEALTTTARRLAELVHPDDRERLREATIAAFKGAQLSFHAQFRIQVRGGPWKWVYSQGQVTEHDSIGRAVRLTGTIAPVQPLAEPV
ncbi:MAG TPA: PAS domain-containing protein [Burkholderiales bacterium]|nr:PAS domain-containing protein [Burkholderiales bacterium]